MKKIIALAIVAVSMVSASFALNLSVGARGNAGMNLDVNNGTIDQITEASKEFSMDTPYDLGFSVYGNAAILGGLGVQLEANFVTSNASFKNVSDGKTSNYETMLLDVPVMVWLNLDLANFVVGVGAGPNFSTRIKEMSEIKDLKEDAFKMGVAVGVDGKFFFNKNLALVASVRYVMDFNKTEVPIEVEGYAVGSYPSVEFTRKSIYGGVGLEFKIL